MRVLKDGTIVTDTGIKLGVVSPVDLSLVRDNIDSDGNYARRHHCNCGCGSSFVADNEEEGPQHGFVMYKGLHFKSGHQSDSVKQAIKEDLQGAIDSGCHSLMGEPISEWLKKGFSK